MEIVKKQFAIIKVIWLGSLASIFIYWFFASFFLDYKFRQTEIPASIAQIRVIFLLISFSSLLIIPIMKKSLQKKECPVDKKVQALAAFETVKMAVSENPALLGLVLAFLSKDINDFYYFAILALVFFSINFPKFSFWEDCLRADIRGTQ